MYVVFFFLPPDQSTEQKLKDENRTRSKRLPICSERVEKLADMVVNSKANNSKRECAVKDLQQKLKKVIRSNVEQLIRFIFPIAVIKPSRRYVSYPMSSSRVRKRKLFSLYFSVAAWKTVMTQCQL